MPSPGTITGLRPAAGPWVRDDSGAYEGYTVPRCYDTLLAKLIVWGADRPAAIDAHDRGRWASTRWWACGPPFPPCSASSRIRDFRAGRLSTALPRARPARPGPAAREGRHAPIAVIAAVLAEYERARHTTVRVEPSVETGAWRSGGRLGWQRPGVS